MTLTTRPAERADLEVLADLLVADAQARHKADPGLWRMAEDARAATREAIETAMTADAPPVRQQWLLAEQNGQVVGATHSILLPVPPIYAGPFGPPGLIMEDCHVAPGAPPETRQALLAAAQADLRAAGARILLTSSVPGGDWIDSFLAEGFEPLTLYLGKTGLGAGDRARPIRPAQETDIEAIVGLSATHRAILAALHARFWQPHPQADARFGAWMTRSLTLTDRDMSVCERAGAVAGYAISQPVTPLHMPLAHDITGVGIIDDFYHMALEDPARLGPEASDAAALLRAAEAARAARGDHSVLVVCPAAWPSKISLLEAAGYRTALIWFIKFVP